MIRTRFLCALRSETIEGWVFVVENTENREFQVLSAEDPPTRNYFKTLKRGIIALARLYTFLA